jgi:hypothetical protein
MSYQPYPTGGGSNQMAERPPAPQSIQNAVKLMYVGAGLSAISLIVGLLTISSLKSAIQTANRTAKTPLTASQLHTAEAVGIASIIVLGLLGIGLWLWMARANGSGKSWARVVASVLFGLNTVGLLSVIARPNSALTKIFDVLVWLVGLGAIVFLYRRDSSEYFAQSRMR